MALLRWVLLNCSSRVLPWASARVGLVLPRCMSISVHRVVHKMCGTVMLKSLNHTDRFVTSKGGGNGPQAAYEGLFRSVPRAPVVAALEKAQGLCRWDGLRRALDPWT